MPKKIEDNLEEVHRRQTIAQIHKAGTEIRKEEMERIKMSARILLARSKSIYEAIKDKDSMVKRGIENLQKIDEAETEEEEQKRIVKGIGDFVDDLGTAMLVQPEVDGLIQATNDLIEQLESQGVHFTFPEFKSYPGITACKFTLEGIIGFLEGVAES